MERYKGSWRNKVPCNEKSKAGDRLLARLHATADAQSTCSKRSSTRSLSLAAAGRRRPYPRRPTRRTSLFCGAGHQTGETATEEREQSPPVEPGVATRTMLRSLLQAQQTLAYGGLSLSTAAELAAWRRRTRSATRVPPARTELQTQGDWCTGESRRYRSELN